MARTTRTKEPTRKSTSTSSASSAKSSAKSTVSGPSRSPASSKNGELAAQKMAATQEMVAAMPHNANKAAEYGKNARTPPTGQTVEPATPAVTASTLTETRPSPKTGKGKPPIGQNPNQLPLDRVRTDASGQALTTNQGIPLGDNQSSLKAGLRGPTLIEDFILREKITHFDHERIPERIVHARGSGAHGFFECYAPLEKYTRASIFAQAGKRTPVFVRFSTVAGERGSTDTARDVRGFAVKFYTDQGNWDLVGNNIPVFFIQDAMKFPDLIHAAKPEPHHAMPQAATAHDTFWDFVSLMPESTHMLMWAMSDRAIPRSYRTMQGFGVHTFRFVNGAGQATFVKFHWSPIAGTHSLVWDEAVKISGADSDFHRRDLWESIETGNFPEYELGVQLFTEEQADKFSFDILDATKIVPEELVPVTPIGKMTLDRNPDNFFAETEQVAFCTSHVVPGIDFSNDPLLAGRLHSYQDTQISRLGGPNFHEIPINAPVAEVHNNQRDGMHRQAINRGRVAYEPNSLGGGCPFQAGARGFSTFPERITADKVRAKPEKFADHYTQATLFYASQSPFEKAHIQGAFRFELTKVQVPAIRQRMVANLANVDEELAEALAADLGLEMPEPSPRAARPARPEVTLSPPLSLMARPGDGKIRGRHIAILVANGIDGEAATALHEGLSALGAVPRFVGPRLGAVTTADGDELEVEVTLETTPAVVYDAVAIPGGKEAVDLLGNLGRAMEFIKDQYRHCKPILALAEASELVVTATRQPEGSADAGVILAKDGDPKKAVKMFAQAIARHRFYERETDPPAV